MIHLHPFHRDFIYICFLFLKKSALYIVFSLTILLGFTYKTDTRKSLNTKKMTLA